MKGLVEPIKDRNKVEELEQYLAKRNKRNRLIFALGINTGLRISDILGLNVSDVKGKNYIRIREKKTGKYKGFPLNDKLKFLLDDFLKDREDLDEPLFIGRYNKRLDRSQVYRFLNKACSDLDINANIGCHSMRKVFGLFFYKQYNDVVLLQKIFNHSSPSITLRYIGIDQDEIDMSYRNFQI